MKTIVRNFLSILRRFQLATILNVLGLSVAFAAFIVLMMQVRYDWGFDRFHKQGDCIYRLGLSSPDAGNSVVHARPFADAFVASSPHIKAGTLLNSWGAEVPLTVERKGEKVNFWIASTAITPDYTQIFDFDMVEGKAGSLEIPGTVLIPESVARKFFEGEEVVGRKLEMGKASWSIGGVYKDFPANSVVGNNMYRGISLNENTDQWNSRMYQLYVLLDSPQSKDEILSGFKAQFQHEQYNWKTQDLRLTQVPDIYYENDAQFDSQKTKGSRMIVLVLFTIAVLTVVIAGINFTNFSNAIVPMRIRSINTQKVLGSSDRVLHCSMLVEALAISLFSFALSLIWVKWASGTWLTGMVSADMALKANVPLLLTAGVVSVLVGVLAGIYPAWYITSFPPALVLKGSYGLSSSGRSLRNALIGIQFVVSFALIIAAIFIYLQNHYMTTSQLGFDKEQIATVKMNSGLIKNTATLSNRMENESLIQGVSFADALLSDGDEYMIWGRGYRDDNLQFVVLSVSPDFLQLMNIPVVSGRDFRQDDIHTAGGAYLFNRTACEQYGLVAGEYITGNEYYQTEPAVIAGFVDDVRFASFRTSVSPMAFYVAPEKSFYPQYAYIKIKKGVDMHEAVASINKVFKSVDPDCPVEVAFYDTVLNNLYKRELSLGSLISLFSLLAVFISVVGVFGLVIFESEYRRKEIGLRKVHGASIAEILVMFNKTYLYILVICFVVAAPLSYYGISRWLENFAYKVSLYWWVFGVSFIVVTVVTLLTVTFQNWHAANENPVNSIKAE